MSRDKAVQEMMKDIKIDEFLESHGYKTVTGVDEAGRGPLAGPVVAAAVIIPDDVTIDGLDDSKKLSPEKREALFTEIAERELPVSIGIIDNKTQGKKIEFKSLPDFALEIINDGGLLEHIKKK